MCCPAVCSHGLSRTDYHIQYDPQLSFRKFVRERRGRAGRNAAAELSAAIASVRGVSSVVMALIVPKSSRNSCFSNSAFLLI